MTTQLLSFLRVARRAAMVLTTAAAVLTGGAAATAQPLPASPGAEAQQRLKDGPRIAFPCARDTGRHPPDPAAR